MSTWVYPNDSILNEHSVRGNRAVDIFNDIEYILARSGFRVDSENPNRFNRTCAKCTLCGSLNVTAGGEGWLHNCPEENGNTIIVKIYHEQLDLRHIGEPGVFDWRPAKQ